MGSKNFSHSGSVIEIGDGYVKVSVESQGACGGCAARAKCGMVDNSTRIIIVENRENKEYRIGQSVNVAITQQMGVRSVVIAYIIPLIILVGVLVVASSLLASEGLAALAALAFVALYYVGVYIFRSKLEKQIKFTIEN